MRTLAPLVVGLALLGGCASAPAPRPAAVPEPAPAVTSAPAAPSQVGGRVAALARRFIGTPYRYGGDSPAGFDCSGLVYYVYREAGIAVPRTALEQRAQARHIPSDALEPGDLVFFYTPEDHVGIYLGNGEFVHAPASGRTVVRARLDSPFFILGFAGGGRFAPP